MDYYFFLLYFFLKIVYYCNVFIYNVYWCISIVFIYNLFLVGIYVDSVRLLYDKFFFIRMIEGCWIF